MKSSILLYRLSSSNRMIELHKAMLSFGTSMVKADENYSQGIKKLELRGNFKDLSKKISKKSKSHSITT